jgi:UDP-N-acetylmuramoylalanine--D-glutamate ligase
VKIQALNGQRVCIVGYGTDGKAMVQALKRYAPKAQVTLADLRTDITIDGVDVKLGPDYLRELDRFDVILKTSGISYRDFEPGVWGKLSSATQVFFDSTKDSGATIIGVTGSKGKSTTASLIHHLLAQAGRASYLVGNIGVPMIDLLDRARSDAIFVIELSAHQLERLTVSPHIAVVTSFFPEHLDFFADLEAYFDAKATIGRFQSADDWFYYNSESEACVRMAELSGAGHKVGVRSADCPVPITSTQLIGDHNARNIAAAWFVAQQLGVAREDGEAAIASFPGLPHRLESLGIIHGIEWIDDTISTTPESVVAAMQAIDNRLGCLILGGQDRGLDFGALGKMIARSNIAGVILLGASGPRIRTEIEAALTAHPRGLRLETTFSMADAVVLARRLTPQGKVCLLSPASPSYDMYPNFEAKGADFAKAIGG